ncbi:MAG: tyrosinase family protein [Acidobacteriota bacterium]
MSSSRRGFIRAATLGPVSLALWSQGGVAQAQGHDHGAADGDGPADCTLPVPPPAERFIPNEPRVIERISAAEMAAPGQAERLATFRRGFEVVRAKPESDVTGWTKQIAQHCISCAGSNTHNIHYDWFFTTWHRAYLYFLERILRKAAGDDLRLVYWNWESEASRTLPEIYAPEGQSLYWARRRLTGPNWPLSDEDVAVDAILALPNFEDFGGTREQRNPTPAAYSGAHANVHNAFSPGDMANLQYSPRDPVFYAHHGNIDRLWSSWSAVPGHENPDFGEDRVYFYDENGVWRYTLLNDLVDTEKLGYRYSSLMVPEGQNRRAMRTLAKARNSVAFSTAEVATLTDSGPDFMLIQNVRNLQLLPADATVYGIFTDDPPVGTESRGSASFLGTMSRVLSEGHDHVDAPLSAAFNVTGKLGVRARARAGQLSFFVAVLDDEGKTTTAAIPLVADDIHLIQ